MAVLETVLNRLELKLNPDKTRVVDARVQRFDFLGLRTGWRVSRRSGKVISMSSRAGEPSAVSRSVTRN